MLSVFGDGVQLRAVLLVMRGIVCIGANICITRVDIVIGHVARLVVVVRDCSVHCFHGTGRSTELASH